MPEKIIVPPIKSQGIKTKLVPWIRGLVPSRDGRWIEPFLGTGVVGFNMGFERAILSDSNPHIIRFYSDIQTRKITPAIVNEFLEKEAGLLCKAGDNGYDHFRLVKDRFNTTFEPLDLLFLSRAGFNGMMRFNKQGKWNIPFCQKPERFREAYVTKIVNQVKACSLLIKPGWQFLNRTFGDVIAMAQAGDVIYCDPPYFGRYVDYYNGWTEENEAKLFELLSSTRARFILSTWHHNDYRANESVSKYWSRFNIVTRNHFYHSGAKEENRKAVVEALVFNFDAKPEEPKKEKARLVQQSLFETVAA
jgi:DNA adenine methylase